jgi:hypothetical protein
MKSNDQTLQVEITISPANGKRGQRRSPASPKAPDTRIPRITRLMALAIKFQDMIDRGEVRDYADIARLGYVSRARLTPIMNLLLLAPNIQERVLFGVPSTASSEKALRAVCAEVYWPDQRSRFGDGRDPSN